jgi:ABC-type multidrug transport system fused ATPase/permease subunit
MSEEEIGLLIGMIAVVGGLMIPIIAILMQPMKIRARQQDQREARQSYERIVREKLEVMKTAIAIGYSQSEMAELDRRLEQLIGADRIAGLLHDQPKTPAITQELLDADFQTEMQKIAKLRAKIPAK